MSRTSQAQNTSLSSLVSYPLINVDEIWTIIATGKMEQYWIQTSTKVIIMLLLLLYFFLLTEQVNWCKFLKISSLL